MRRLVVLLSGLAVGASLGVLLGGCGGYFECETFHHHITEGTYIRDGAGPAFELVIDAERHVVVTYTDGSGSVVRASYTLGAERDIARPL